LEKADDDFRCIVAGAGAAGLAAALTLAQAGQEVLLLEAHQTFQQGCNTSMSTAMIPAAGTPWQERRGVEDSAARFLADVMLRTGGSAEPTVARTLTGVSAEVVGWLAGACGVPLELETSFQYPGHSAYRCHTIRNRSGQTLHRHLVELARSEPRITFGVPFRLTDLILDEHGRVDGATIMSPDGRTEVARAPAVILATSGFGANPDAVRRHIPEIADALYFGGEGSSGDAIAIGSRIGADLVYLDGYQGHGGIAHPHGILVTWAVIMHGGVVVNGAGRRFGDETRGYSEYAEKVLGQPASRAWVIFDQRIGKRCLSFADYQDLLEAKAVRWAPDLASLAELTSCGVELENTILAARDSAVSGTADEFGRSDWEAALEPPFAAVYVSGALLHTQGGLAVDERARVLRSGVPIGGLYAAGGAAVGISGHGASGYIAGNGLLAAFGLGYLAGRDVASH
jgi:fumarate reductase flavoprotein subunit